MNTEKNTNHTKRNAGNSRIEMLLTLSNEQLITLHKEATEYVELCVRMGDWNLHKLALEQRQLIGIVLISKGITEHSLPI